MDVERVIFRIFADAAPYSRVVRDAERQMVDFSRHATGLGNEITVPIVAATTALVSLAAGIAGASVVAVKAAADFERTSISLEVMTGSAETAAHLMDQIAEFSVSTPFSFQEIHSVAASLKAMGLETDQLLPTMHNLANAVSASQYDFKKLAYAYGEVMVAGRLMGPQLREFVNAKVPLIPALEEITRATGKFRGSIRSMVESGSIGIPEVIAAFNLLNQKGGIYFGMTDRALGSTSGSWDSYTKTVEIGLRKLGLSFFKTFGTAGIIRKWKDEIEGLSADPAKFDRFWESIKSGLKSLQDIIRPVVVWIERNRELLIIIGKVALGLFAVWAAVGLIKLAFSAAMIPLLGMISGWRALVLAIGFLFNAEGILQLKSWPALFQTIQNWFVRLTGSGEDLNGLFKKMSGIMIALATAWGVYRLTIVATGLVMSAYRLITIGLASAQLFLAVATSALAFTNVIGALGGIVFVIGVLGPLLAPLAAGFGVLGSAVGLIESPLQSILDEIGRTRLAEFGQEFKNMTENLIRVFGTTWDEIQKAIKTGDFKGAAEAAFKGIEVAFHYVVAAMRLEWLNFTNSIMFTLEQRMELGMSAMAREFKKTAWRTEHAGKFFSTDDSEMLKAFKRIDEEQDMIRREILMRKQDAIPQAEIDRIMEPARRVEREMKAAGLRKQIDQQMEGIPSEMKDLIKKESTYKPRHPVTLTNSHADAFQEDLNLSPLDIIKPSPFVLTKDIEVPLGTQFNLRAARLIDAILDDDLGNGGIGGDQNKLAREFFKGVSDIYGSTNPRSISSMGLADRPGHIEGVEARIRKLNQMADDIHKRMPGGLDPLPTTKPLPRISRPGIEEDRTGGFNALTAIGGGLSLQAHDYSRRLEADLSLIKDKYIRLIKSGKGDTSEAAETLNKFYDVLRKIRDLTPPKLPPDKELATMALIGGGLPAGLSARTSEKEGRPILPYVPINQASAEVRKFVDENFREMQKEGKQGIGGGAVGIYDQLLKDFAMIDEAVHGPDQLRSAYAAGGGMLGAIPKFKFERLISPEEEDFARFTKFNVFARQADKGQDVLPRPMLAGSAEAQDTINRAGQQQISVLEQVRLEITRGIVLQEEQKRYEAARLEAIETVMKEIRDNKSIIKVGKE